MEKEVYKFTDGEAEVIRSIHTQIDMLGFALKGALDILMVQKGLKGKGIPMLNSDRSGFTLEGGLPNGSDNSGN